MKCPVFFKRVKVRLFSPTQFERFVFFFVLDILCCMFSILLALFVIYGRDFPLIWYYAPFYLVFSLPLRLGVFSLAGVYRITWRYVGLQDIVRIIAALVTATILLALLLPLFGGLIVVPKRFVVVEFFLLFFLVLAVRVSKRFYYEILTNRRVSHARKALIIGAGNMGEIVVRSLLKNNCDPYLPVGFLDDDKQKRGSTIQNVKVLGPLDDIVRIIENYQIEAVIIAIASLKADRLKELYAKAVRAGVTELKVIPRYFLDKPAFDDTVAVQGLQDVNLEDVLGRQEIIVDREKVREFLEGRTILVTGSAGSIGGEICEQLCSFRPERLLLYEIDETELFYQEKRLKERYPEIADRIVPLVGDIRDEGRLEAVFRVHTPQIVFHAAAYKHVPLMEGHPAEAVKTNILGTFNLCRVAERHGVGKFVLISTDKAVNPTSIMGATKRFCEYLAMGFNAERSQFMAVRFGNVLGSRGSVLPVFLEQIRRGGPVTVTHPEMKRYFMTTREAVTLVLEASATGRGGDVLVLDMGEPVNILGLAEELIRLQGREPYRDIQIAFSGIRPGEKIFEELLTSEEGTRATKYEKIFAANISRKHSREFMEEKVSRLRAAAEDDRAGEITAVLREVISTFRPGGNDRDQ